MKRQFNDGDKDNMKKKNKPMSAQKGLTTEIDHGRTFRYRVYWFDESTIRDPFVEYRIDQSKLRGIIDYIEMYTMVNRSMEEIERYRTKDEQIIVIITISNKLDLMNKFHHLSYIHSIYIYAPLVEGISTIDENTLSRYTKVNILHFSQ
jgi:hypothetical protein